MKAGSTGRIWLLSAATAMVLLSASFACAATLDLASLASDGAQGNLASRSPAISADGRFVAFASDADNLVPGDVVPRWGTDPDIFLRDLEAWREGDDPDGRVYTVTAVTAVAADAAGNRTVATAEAVVPHDMRGKKGE